MFNLSIIHTFVNVPQRVKCQVSNSLVWNNAAFHHVSKKDPSNTRIHHPLLGQGILLGSERKLSVSPKAILDSSPPSIQPYLRLIRFDKPIGETLYPMYFLECCVM